ncbi:MAG: bifunctional adenosylcobinamide kinase/adenosylcobinamide-phosphate guanylyltransferase [Synergistaceae bacterium]|nr:bifunctional adenosylcobinamide kinase/adenosylcobinamide-phosphate guanylyltransferase [Synergistaceae bacterium]
MGKRDYAVRLYGAFPAVYDLEHDSPDIMAGPGLVLNLHAGVKSLMTRGIDPAGYFAGMIGTLRECVITCDEISGGIIPADGFARKWRDETGRLCQYLAGKADIVDRVFAGLALRLKG